MVGFQVRQPRWWGWPPNPYEALEDEYSAADVSDLSAADVLDLTASATRRQTELGGPGGPVDGAAVRLDGAGRAGGMGSGGYEVDVLNAEDADLMMDSAANPMRN